VYGAAKEERKQNFIVELHNILLNEKTPTILGGDFNLVRFQKDKSNGRVDLRWCDKFNDWIDKNSLIEINLLGKSFTWSNNQEKLILSLIDRIFYSTEFDGIFPLATARSLSRNPNDHVPILWESGQAQTQRKRRFKFEKWWLQHGDFAEVVSKVWKTLVGGWGEDNSLERWKNKVKLFWRKTRGWSANGESKNRKRKNRRN
jgi:hypothetical protein